LPQGTAEKIMENSPDELPPLVPQFVVRFDQVEDQHIVCVDERYEMHVASFACFCIPELTHLEAETWNAIYTHKTVEQLTN